MAERDARAPALNGVGVLVTRPAAQADNLCRLVEALGGRAIRFPVLEIRDPDNLAPVHKIVDHLSDYDIAIFISPNAVNKALNLVLGDSGKSWPDNVRIAAVGKASAKSITGFGLTPDIFPKTRFDSEALLEMDALQAVQDKKILIFRGEGGRELLAETLRQRGAHVDYAEVYRRVKPQADVSNLMRLWARGDINIITVTSNESLQNLYDMVGQLGRRWLIKTPLIVVSERGKELASQLGFKAPVIVAEQAGDDAISNAIKLWAAQHYTSNPV